MVVLENVNWKFGLPLGATLFYIQGVQMNPLTSQKKKKLYV